MVRALLRSLDFMYAQPRGSEKPGPQADQRVGDGYYRPHLWADNQVCHAQRHPFTKSD